MKTVNILGTEYTIRENDSEHDSALNNCDGYCDKTSKEIVICKKESDCDLADFEIHKNKVLRHEIIHAFFFESGLCENVENKQYGISETMVDWIAIQSPKMMKVFQEVGCL